MAQHIMLPGLVSRTTTVFGRTYTAAIGGIVTAVSDSDANMLEANGWTRATSGGSGTTTQRPTKLPSGQPLSVGYGYNDTTLGYEVIWTGTQWSHPQTGVSV
jgi:hypothetical protein